MRLEDAREIIREVSGKSYRWLEQWGLGTIRTAIRTIENRQSATNEDRALANDIRRKLMRKW